VLSRYRSHTYATELNIQLFTLVEHVIFFFVLVIQVVIVVVSKVGSFASFTLTLVSALALSLVVATMAGLAGGPSDALVVWGCPLSAGLLPLRWTMVLGSNLLLGCSGLVGLPGFGRLQCAAMLSSVLSGVSSVLLFVVSSVLFGVPSVLLFGVSSVLLFGVSSVLLFGVSSVLLFGVSSVLFAGPLCCLVFVGLLWFAAPFCGLVHFRVAFVGLRSILVLNGPSLGSFFLLVVLDGHFFCDVSDC